MVGAAPRREKWRNFHRRYRGEGAAPTYNFLKHFQCLEN